ncbi:Reverse transcriptase-like [Novymonas esmeraldas]|uniref:Reverse transcriptase-like n=2 Tax=Novymonas esmeraldas TaxID=1808958 RepID=A0AAW0F4D9_9TRYP
MHVGDLEVFASRAIFGAAILGIRLFRYYMFLKFVRRKLSALNRGATSPSTRAQMTPYVERFADDLLQVLRRNEARSVPRRGVEPSATLVTDASLQGWGAVLFMDAGPVLIAGARWPETPGMIMQAEARAVRLGLLAFRTHIPRRLRILIDNTSVLGAVRRGISKSGALAVELQEVDHVLREGGVEAEYRYIRSENNVADWPSRALDVPRAALAKGYHLRRGDRDPWDPPKDP